MEGMPNAQGPQAAAKHLQGRGHPPHHPAADDARCDRAPPAHKVRRRPVSAQGRAAGDRPRRRDAVRRGRRVEQGQEGAPVHLRRRDIQGDRHLPCGHGGKVAPDRGDAQAASRRQVSRARLRPYTQAHREAVRLGVRGAHHDRQGRPKVRHPPHSDRRQRHAQHNPLGVQDRQVWQRRPRVPQGRRGDGRRHQQVACSGGPRRKGRRLAGAAQ